MKNPLICANWKMNKTLSEGVDYVVAFNENESLYSDVNIVLFPNIISLAFLSEIREPNSVTQLGIQNLYVGENGPYTGESSLNQVEGYVDYVLVGHSERRNIFDENNDLVQKKVTYFLNNSNLTVVLCVGESRSTYDSGDTELFLTEQLASSLKNIDKNHLKKLVIAYEPCWAISDGTKSKVTPTPEKINTINGFIRNWVEKKYDKDIADDLHILYGGSVNRDNANIFIQEDNIDGFLVGGASLDASHFHDIVMESVLRDQR